MNWDLPEWINVWKVARALRWGTKETRAIFIRTGFAQKVEGLGRGWFVQRDRLVSQMPYVAEKLIELYRAGKIGMPGRARCRTVSHQKASARGARGARGPANGIQV